MKILYSMAIGNSHRDRSETKTVFKSTTPQIKCHIIIVIYQLNRTKSIPV